MQVEREHGRRSPGRLDEGVAVAGRDARRRDGQQRGDRAEDQVDVVLVDQGLVVGDHLGGAGGVVDDLELNLAAEDAARLVDLAGPELVALLRGLAGVAEVAGQGEGDADDEWRLGARLRACGAGGAAAPPAAGSPGAEQAAAPATSAAAARSAGSAPSKQCVCAYCASGT